MTTNRQPHRLRRQAGEGNGSGGAAAGDPPISERLRAAREARGVDLFRVERDTKIRVKYLSAMESGLFSELPGDVYARGFLRNYASYLGLDADEAEGEWRRGNIASAARAASVKANAAQAEKASAPPFKMPTFRVPALKWPAATTAGEASARPTQVPTSPADSNRAAIDSTVSSRAATTSTGPKQTPANGKQALAAAKKAIAAPAAPAAGSGGAKVAAAEPSILESPAWSRPPFAVRIPALLLRFREKESPAPPIGGPQPIDMPRRAFLFQPAHVVILLLVLVVAGVGLFFAQQAGRVLQDPTLTVTSPAQAVTSFPSGTTTVTFQGIATSKASISVSWDQRPPIHAVADASGKWSFAATLHNGVNQFDIYSTDVSTGHNSATVTRVINVETPTASPVPEYLSVDSPTDGQAFQDGNFILTGTTVAIASVTITQTYLGPAPAVLPTPKPTKTIPAGQTAIPTAVPTLVPLPSVTVPPLTTAAPQATPTPNASNAPLPITVIPTIDGKFSAQMHLWSGRWSLSVTGVNTAGVNAAPVNLTVIVTSGSLVVDIQAKGGSPSVKIWKDGKVLAGYPHILRNGTTVRIVADQSVWISTGLPNSTYVTVNGVSFGRLGTSKSNKTASWRITAIGPPTLSNDR
jgi:transcriptional regulator with XRE-family HTH domain